MILLYQTAEVCPTGVRVNVSSQSTTLRGSSDQSLGNIAGTPLLAILALFLIERRTWWGVLRKNGGNAGMSEGGIWMGSELRICVVCH